VKLEVQFPIAIAPNFTEALQPGIRHGVIKVVKVTVVPEHAQSLSSSSSFHGFFKKFEERW